jgi:hypothetical protein
MAVRQQQRRGTAAQWTSANPILSPGEIGFETDTNKFKIGNGTTRWVSLVYFTADAAAALEDLIDGAPGLLDTLNELAAAVGDDANFFSTVTSNIATAKSGAEATAASALSTHNSSTNVHGIANTALLATLTDVANAVSGAEVDQSALAGTGLLWDGVNDQFTIDTTVATKTYADNAASTAVSALTKSSVGLANVDNTTDANKPVSIDTQAALDLKANLASPTFTGVVTLPNNTIQNQHMGDDSVGMNELAGNSVSTEKIQDTAVTSGKLSMSLAFTGTPTAPTASVGTDTTQVATTAFVKAAIQDISSLNLVLDGGGV